nr:MAG TPA: hypothetical protein [Herelleviridae sp.]
MNKTQLINHLASLMNEWVDSVPATRQDVRQAINRCTIAGGAIVSLLQDISPNDYDVYTKTKEDCELLARYYVGLFNWDNHLEQDEYRKADVLVEGEQVKVRLPAMDGAEIKQDVSKFRPIFISPNAITLKGNVQLIFRFYGEPEKIVREFDFEHCTGYFQRVCWENRLVLTDDMLLSVLSKELKYRHGKYPVSSLIRLQKYIQRGYTIPTGELIKLALDISKLDLSDAKVFSDQLSGVDLQLSADVLKAANNEFDKVQGQAILDQVSNDGSLNV